MKKNLLMTIFSLVMIFNVAAAAEKKEIKIDYFDVPPHIYQDEKTGEIKGAAYEFLEKYMAPEINVKFVWQKSPTVIPRQLENLEGNDYASALLISTPDRMKKFLFPQTAYGSGTASLAVLKTNKLQKIQKAEDIAGLKIGYATNAFITPFMKSDKIIFELVSASNYNEVNFKKLQAKRIDAVYTPDEASLLFYIKQMALGETVKVLSLPESPAIYNVAFSRNLTDVAERYNTAFKKVDGVKLYQTLLQKYIR